MTTGFVSIEPENMEWKMPWGAGSPQLAFLDGDPSKPGIYVVRVNYPPNVFIRPHWREARSLGPAGAQVS